MSATNNTAANAKVGNWATSPKPVEGSWVGVGVPGAAWARYTAVAVMAKAAVSTAG